jgi:hypothetical protein
MPGPLLHVGAVATCPHGMGQLSIISSNARVLVSGQPVATAADTGVIAGCAFTVPTGKPQPCTSVKWLMPSTRVTVGGQPAGRICACRPTRSRAGPRSSRSASRA